MSYRLNFTDSANNPRGIIVEDQSLNNTDTDLVFVGKNFPGYSQFIGENFLHILENFARNTPPNKPVLGQLWYDTGTLSTPVKPQLKVFDGTTWTEAGNVKKSIVRPSTQTSVVGDLWVDTTNQQLYLFTGTAWTLVGPQFSEKNLSGFKVDELFDRNDTLKTIISIVVNDERIAVVSKDEFIPKEVTSGFPIIRSGITLSSFAVKKFWGTSEKADALIVGNNTVPAASFLRSDVISTTNFPLNVRNRLGVNIGESLETSITSTDVGTVIRQKTANNRSIILQTTDASGSNDVLIVTGNKRVGVNVNPEESLHVNGNILTNGSIRSTNTSANSIETQGGVQIGGNLTVSGNKVSVLGELEIGSVGVEKSILFPISDRKLDLGRIDRRFRTIYADSIVATFSGNLDGNISGSAGTANSLTNPVPFSITGDVASTQSVFFDGTQSNLVINVGATESLIANRVEDLSVPSSLNDFLLVYNPTGTPPLRRIRKSTFLGGIGSVPVGALMPFAGGSVPGGWLLCDGAEVSRSQYPLLFSVIGNTYRPTSLLRGSNTFGLPDLRGRFALGRENMDNGNNITVNISASGVERLPVFTNAISATFIVPDSSTINGPFQIGRVITGTGLSGSNIVVSAVTPNTPSAGFTTIVVSCPGQPNDLPPATNLSLISQGIIDAGGGNPIPARVPAATSIGIVGGQSVQTTTGSSTSGGFNSLPSGSPIDIMNPFLTVNYIIYAGA